MSEYETEGSGGDRLENQNLESNIAGYIVTVPVPPGLYLPRFNLTEWRTRQEDDLLHPSSFWSEGLAPEEIEQIAGPHTQPLSEIDQLKEELTSTQLALTDTYEQLLQLHEELAKIKEDAE